jgi:hypothetical protein
MQHNKTQHTQPQTFSMKELRNNVNNRKQERLALAKQHADALSHLEYEHRKSCARDFGNVIGGAAGKVGERVAYCYLLTRGPLCCLLVAVTMFGFITRSHDIMQEGMRQTPILEKAVAAPAVVKEVQVQPSEIIEEVVENHSCPHCQADLGNDELPKLSGIGKREFNGQDRWYGFCPNCGSFLGFALDRGVFVTKLNGKELVSEEVQNLTAQLKSELKKIGKTKFKKKYGIQ